MWTLNISLGSKKKNKQSQQTADPQEQDERTWQLIRKALEDEDRQYAKMNTIRGDVEAPAMGGRSSIPTALNYSMGINSREPIPTDFPFEHLKFLQGLSMWNRHIGQAVDNIVSLGNTDYTVSFGDDTPDELAEQMRKHLTRKSKTWYNYAEGENSLDTDVLAQLAVYGCLSLEAVPRRDLTGIEKVVLVDPYTIRFRYDRAIDRYLPMQKTNIANSSGRNNLYPGHVDLNELTYCYMAMRRFNEIPYAIPPFLTALEDVIIENDMVKNFSNMMRRMGMLGFLSVLFALPKKQNNENDIQYNARLKNYLESYREPIEKGFHKGIIFGFKDSHEVKLDTHSNTRGAGELMDTVHKLIYSGVKQDPAMHGENFSTTETFARVILAKMSTQVKGYQKVLAEWKARIFKLELLLAGFPVDVVEVEYELPTISDRKHDAEAYSLEIENAKALYNDGIISQETRAQLLGYDEPDMDEPRFNDMIEIGPAGNASGAREDETGDPTSTESNQAVQYTEAAVMKIIIHNGGGRQEFNYTIPDGCCDHDDEQFITVTDFLDPSMKRFVNNYVHEVDDEYTSFVNKAVKKMHSEIRKAGDHLGNVSAGTILKYVLYSQWENNFVTPVQSVVEKHIDRMYSYYRKDEKVFRDSPNFTSTQAAGRATSGEHFFNIPQPVFNLVDARAVEFLNAIDKFWLGKFITDEDSVRRVNKFIETELLGKNIEIGPNSQALHAFIDRFGDEIMLENYKIRRILETTANRTRNTANVMYLNQAEITEYEVVEIGDTRTCEWCLYMHGQTFQVAPTVEKIQRLTNNDFTNLPELAPFATSMPIEQFKNLSAVELQSMGHDVPSYHPHCRGRVVAKF